ncbi:MAG: 7-carboxy-7-deazaguanine synthase [Saprospiraceae bacterium]|nr:7-carboxy-7-deazaguanine synthase [Saprospiraceae bacterium]
MYSVKEIYFTLQGEGLQTGRPSVFCRFAGCNLWTGREEDRDNAVCQFCDTDFFGIDGVQGGRYTAEDLAVKIHSLWPHSIRQETPYVVCTGGEPLLQIDQTLISALHRLDIEIGVETNGTIAVPEDLDWICVSPKADAECVVRKGQELKIVYPQSGIDPADYENWDFDYFFLQPMDGPTLAENTRKTVAYCLEHPLWRLSVQMHKLAGLK